MYSTAAQARKKRTAHCSQDITLRLLSVRIATLRVKLRDTILTHYKYSFKIALRNGRECPGMRRELP